MTSMAGVRRLFSSMSGMRPRIHVKGTVVEMDGDEMTRLIWQEIKKKLILPFVDVKLDYYDLGLPMRDATKDGVTREAGTAILRHGVGIKCATITPDAARIAEYGLQNGGLLKSPNGILRSMLNGTVFREPILIDKIPRCVPAWKQPIIIGRHAFADQYQATELRIDQPGQLKLLFDGPAGPQELLVHAFKGPGVGLAMFNLSESITGFAHSCFKMALARRLPMFLSTKNTILKVYDAEFVETFQRIYEAEYRVAFEQLGLVYEHRLIDDMVAQALKSAGGFLWATKNYDGDVQSDIVAQGFGSLGLMSSVLLDPSGRICETEAAHGTVTRHYRQHQRGQITSTNSIASIFAWTKGLQHRALLDDNSELRNFCSTLESAVIDLVQQRDVMTKDLASLIYPGEAIQLDVHYVDTWKFIDSAATLFESRWNPA